MLTMSQSLLITGKKFGFILLILKYNATT